jgi:hypothetical protein
VIVQARFFNVKKIEIFKSSNHNFVCKENQLTANPMIFLPTAAGIFASNLMCDFHFKYPTPPRKIYPAANIRRSAQRNFLFTPELLPGTVYFARKTQRAGK